MKYTVWIRRWVYTYRFSRCRSSIWEFACTSAQPTVCSFSDGQFLIHAELVFSSSLFVLFVCSMRPVLKRQDRVLKWCDLTVPIQLSYRIKLIDIWADLVKLCLESWQGYVPLLLVQLQWLFCRLGDVHPIHTGLRGQTFCGGASIIFRHCK